jgi:hypothetical protein
MAVDPRQLAERLGLEFRVEEGPNESDAWPVADVTVSFFEEGDPAFSFVARDGALIPRGVPVESFREDLAKAGGVFRLPDGTPHPVSIPDDVKDGGGFYVNLAVTKLKPGI